MDIGRFHSFARIKNARIRIKGTSGLGGSTKLSVTTRQNAFGVLGVICIPSCEQYLSQAPLILQ